MSDKKKYPRADALAVAAELCRVLKPLTERLIVAGSLRRRKPMVGDVEILYIPKQEYQALDLFSTASVSLVDDLLNRLLKEGIIQQRKNVHGSVMWGDKNKLALHAASGIPVDFFSANVSNWFNYLVCRTGGAGNNMQIASAAQKLGMKWNPYGIGFTDRWGKVQQVTRERDAFDFVGLPFKEPWERL